MTVFFEELQSLVGEYQTEESTKKAESYIRLLNILKTVTGVLFVLIFVTALFAQQLFYIDEIAFALFFFAYFFVKHNQKKATNEVLFDECRPEKAAGVVLTNCSHAKTDDQVATQLYTLGAFLYYAGDFDKLKKVIEYMEARCPGDYGAFQRYLLKIKLAAGKRDRVKVKKLSKELIELHQRFVPKNKELKAEFDEVKLYPHYIDQLNNREYDKLYKSVELTNAPKKGTFGLVRKNYYLYLLAKKAGNAEAAEKHRDYVLSKGGTTFYRKRLMAKAEDANGEGAETAQAAE